ncbi:hypothetical protein [Methylobacterium sp. Leaf117]|uniref:DUF6894 family protein n=1 Tax=Methylobacterium sp. Leaf117 TaxID=1736260 RepID=UPI0006F7E595|nr:hypothetical protein [Methylobacterium sp. Leaf117]KQP83074.1 hypothetical protein ASF57_13305 [Methylobacterium sp. Leaf117]
MARYFFDFFDGTVMRDSVGHECAGSDEIRHEAMKALPEIAKGVIPQDGDKQAFTVSVRNAGNLTVYTATLTFAGVWMGEDVPPPEEPMD